MASWSRTDHGWAVNLDGTEAAIRFALPRLELRSSPRGWVAAVHLADGTSRLLPLGSPGGVAEAMRRALEGCVGLVSGAHAASLRALLEAAER